MFAKIGLIPPWLAARRPSSDGLSQLIVGRRGLDHSQAPDCQIVDLDLAKMHVAEVCPQDRQPRDGKRTDGKAPRSAPMATAVMRTGGISNSCRRKSRIVVMRTYSSRS